MQRLCKRLSKKKGCFLLAVKSCIILIASSTAIEVDVTLTLHSVSTFNRAFNIR